MVFDLYIFLKEALEMALDPVLGICSGEGKSPARGRLVSKRALERQFFHTRFRSAL